MIGITDNPIFFGALFIGGFGFCTAVLWTIYDLGKDHKKKPQKHKKA
jgi:hypothetical protein